MILDMYSPDLMNTNTKTFKFNHFRQIVVFFFASSSQRCIDNYACLPDRRSSSFENRNTIIGIDENLDLVKMTLIRIKKDFLYNVVYFWHSFRIKLIQKIWS